MVNRDQSGFTMVELVVSVAILAVAGVITAGSMASSTRVKVAADNRTQAVALATREVEGLRALPWSQVGFLASASGFRGSFEGFTTVTVAGTAGSAPTGRDTEASATFSILRDVVWVPVTANGAVVDQGYKRMTVQVSWTDASRTHLVRLDTAVFLPA